ncbi:MAG: aminopeptidase P family protein [Deltaproteobacteria bacterium]|nr:aminopeptidase P family protein [Deltaproteobacteria bacterium]
MLISEEELQRLHKRFPYPRFSDAEYRRRYSNIRKMMREEGVDCLFIIGGSASYGRLWSNIRYLTNMVGKAEMAMYCFFPAEGDPALIVRPASHFLHEGMLARTVVRNFIEGTPSILSAIVNTITEKGYADGRIGIVEYDPFTSIPKNHWDFFTSHLPKAEFRFVTKEFLTLRLIKSEEEIQALERSAELGDIGIRALAEKLRPGMTEGEAFGIVHEAVLRNGGEMGMVQLASTPMSDPDLNDQRPRPVERVISTGDIINDELGIFWNGYEAQTGKPIVVGPPTETYRKLFEVAVEGYKKMRDTLYPGKSSDDSIRAGAWIKETGYDSIGTYLQGMLGTSPRHEPQIGYDRPTSGEDRFMFEGKLVYRPGMVFTLQMHIVDKQRTKGIFLADMFAITASGPKCLNKFPPQLVQV